MCGVSDVTEAVTTRKNRFVKRYVLNNSVVCEMCAICSQVFSISFCIYYVLPILVNKDVCVCVCAIMFTAIIHLKECSNHSCLLKKW